MKIRHITIIGLGLIGGSIARALKERANIQDLMINGIDPNQNAIRQALAEGVISTGSTGITPDIGRSDIVFVCTPVMKTLDWIKEMLPLIRQDCIITDVGSTKSYLINEVEALPASFHFVGGHPMAGSENSGFAASKSHLFENAYYILTPCSKSSEQDIQLLKTIIQHFGCIPIELGAGLHDKITGAISHVPHIISAALVNMVKESDSPEQYMQKLAAGGFKDITRISSSSPEMWHSVCLSNRNAILEILDTYISMLEKIKASITQKDDHEIYAFFNSAKEFRDTFASKITGLIPGTYELIIDVVDKPGIIGEVATLLGRHHINIKNINVSNSREFENGVLIISLPDPSSRDHAYDVLVKSGYKVVNRN